VQGGGQQLLLQDIKPVLIGAEAAASGCERLTRARVYLAYEDYYLSNVR